MVRLFCFHQFTKKKQLSRILSCFLKAAIQSDTPITDVEDDISFDWDNVAKDWVTVSNIKIFFNPKNGHDKITAQMLQVYIEYCMNVREIPTAMNDRIILRLNTEQV